MREYLKRYLKELQSVRINGRILDPDSPDFPYEQWAVKHGPAIDKALRFEHSCRGVVIDYSDVQAD